MRNNSRLPLYYLREHPPLSILRSRSISKMSASLASSTERASEPQSHFDAASVAARATRALLNSRSNSPMARHSRPDSTSESPAPLEQGGRHQRPTIIPIHRRSSFNYSHDLAELSPGQIPHTTDHREYGTSPGHFNREEMKHMQHLKFVFEAVDAFKEAGRRRREREMRAGESLKHEESGVSFSET